MKQRLRGGPRRILLVGAVLILATLVLSTIATVSAARRSTDLATMLSRSEPLATAAQDLYAALSAADAAAAGGFLAGGLEPRADRDSYDAAIATAAGALATFASGAPADPAQRTALSTLVTGLPQYAGLVETARAGNRQGFPVGAAYLREASGLMRTTLLPAAQVLYRQQAATVTNTATSIGRTPWIAILLGLAVIAIAVLGMWRLARISRRRLNLGLLLAMLATAGWVVWTLISGMLAGSALRAAVDSGTTPLNALVQMRITAQQARADETLYLIARGSGGTNEKDFQQHQKDLIENWKTAVATVPDGVQTLGVGKQLDQWTAAHTKLLDAASQGDYDKAVGIGIGESATAFQQVDTGLRGTIDQVGQTLRDDAGRADSALTGVALGIGVLALLAIAGIALGLWPRLREYQ